MRASRLRFALFWFLSAAPLMPALRAEERSPEQSAYSLVQRAAFQRLQRNEIRHLDPYYELIESYLTAEREEAFRMSDSVLPLDASYLWLDLDAASSRPADRLEAALRFPRQAEKAKALFHQHKKTLGGSLPWELENAAAALTTAFERGDRERIGYFGAVVLRLVSHAALPFSTTAAAVADPGETLSFSTSSEKGRFFEACRTLKGRTQDRLLLGRWDEIEQALSHSTRECPANRQPAEAVFDLLLESSATLDAFRTADQELRQTWGIGDGTRFLAVADTFTARFDHECLSLLADRLDQAACLTAVLFYQAAQKEGDRVADPTPSALPSRPDPPSGAAASNGGGSTAQPVSAQKGVFVGSRNSDKVHRPDCIFVARISPQNLVNFPTVKEALQQGRQPCSRCRPSD